MFAFLTTFSPVSGYASWLKCYVDLDADEVIMNRHVNEVDNAPHLVTVEVRLEGTEEWLDNLTFPSDYRTTIEVRLAVPPALIDEDVQFVVETTDGGQFAPPTNMCEGRRSFSRAYDQHVTLVLEGTTPTVSLKAGWAAGHEAVNLTPLLVLRKEPATADEF
jgi:hypothetical protein